MSNPWTKKNPFLSLWLSGGHAAANSARGRMAKQARGHAARAVNQTQRDAFDVWFALATGTAPKRRKRRSR